MAYVNRTWVNRPWDGRVPEKRVDADGIRAPLTKEELIGNTIYMVVGCPGSGKSWVCDQMKDLYTYVHHDLFIEMTGTKYLDAIVEAAKTSKRPLLIEAPFSVSQTKEPLEAMGFKVVPVIIQEAPGVIEARYLMRERKIIPKGHLSRQLTYYNRAKLWNSFVGTSGQVLDHLREAAHILSSKPKEES